MKKVDKDTLYDLISKIDCIYNSEGNYPYNGRFTLRGTNHIIAKIDRGMVDGSSIFYYEDCFVDENYFNI